MELVYLAAAVMVDSRWGTKGVWSYPKRAIEGLVESYRRIMVRCRLENSFGDLLMWVLSLGTVLGLVTIMLTWANRIHPYVHIMLTAYLLIAAMGTAQLRAKASSVILDPQKEALESNDDSNSKDQNTLVGETLARVTEKSTMAVFGPLTFMIIGLFVGWPAHFVYAYKGVKALVYNGDDGHAPQRWIDIKIDYMVDYIPARLGSFLMLLAGGVLGFDLSGGRKIRRDLGRAYGSNALMPLATVAGLLNLQLRGPKTHRAHMAPDKMIGEAIRPPKVSDIDSVCRIISMAAFILMTTGVILLYMIV